MSQKRIKRIRDTNLQYEEAIHEKLKEEIIQKRPDESLFVMDTIGSKTKRRKIEKEVKGETTKGNIVSKTEKLLVDRIIKRSSNHSNGKKQDFVSKKEVHDIWNNDDNNSHVIGNGNDKRIAPKPSIKVQIEPGQSYHPSFEEHQNALAKALALELKKREEEAKKRISFTPSSSSSSLPEIYPSVENKLDDDEDDDIDENDNIENDHDMDMKTKVTERLTRAERNKQKAKKQKSKLANEKVEKALLLKSIDKIPVIIQELEHKQQLSLSKTQFKKLRKQQLEAEKATIPEDSRLIPLSDELNGSLRQLIPKGVAVKVQTLEMSKRGLIMAKDRRKRQKNEKPHGEMKVVWIPKYKYT